MDSIIDSLRLVVNRRIKQKNQKIKTQVFKKYMLQLKISYPTVPEAFSLIRFNFFSFDSGTLRNYGLRPRIQRPEPANQETDNQKIQPLDRFQCHFEMPKLPKRQTTERNRSFLPCSFPVEPNNQQFLRTKWSTQ